MHAIRNVYRNSVSQGTVQEIPCTKFQWQERPYRVTKIHLSWRRKIKKRKNADLEMETQAKIGPAIGAV